MSRLGSGYPNEGWTAIDAITPRLGERDDCSLMASFLFQILHYLSWLSKMMRYCIGRER